MLATWKKSYDKARQHIKNQRHYFANQGLYSQSYVFLVVFYGCESWTIKKTEHQRIDVFKLWCWRRLLRVHWTTRRSNQLISKESNPEYSLEGLNLETLILWPPDVNSWLTGKVSNAQKNWRQKEKRVTGMKCLDGITDSMDITWANSGSWWRTGKPGMLQSMGSWRVRHNWVTE